MLRPRLRPDRLKLAAGKPVLPLAAARIYHEIIAYARRYGVPPDRLAHAAASDCMDGLYLPNDRGVKQLIRLGILAAEPSYGPGTVGVTWRLTELAVGLILATRPGGPPVATTGS